MTDQEGNSYKTIVIGNQEWMAENLKTSTYRNGDAIMNETDAGQWSVVTRPPRGGNYTAKQQLDAKTAISSSSCPWP